MKKPIYLIIILSLSSMTVIFLTSGVFAASAKDSPSLGAIFVDTGQSLGGTNTNAVVAGLLDGDDDLDVFAANGGANIVWLNDGNAQFTDNGQLLGSASSQDIALADLDDDNDIDAVVANDSSPNQVWLNDGFGNFTAGQTMIGNQTRGVAVRDLDMDMDQDIFFVNEGGSDEVWFNDGTGNFTNTGQSLDANAGFDLDLGDLDGDGDLDAFVANGSASNYPDTVWINQGGLQGGAAGAFLDSGQTLGFYWSYGVALGDLDGSPGLDAYIAAWFPTVNKVWVNDGNGIFTDTLQSLGIQGSLGVTLGDVDGDTDHDAVVSNNFPNGIRVWLNDGLGNFADSGEGIATNTSVAGTALADFNGDSAPDLFTASFGPNQVWLNQTAGPVPPSIGFQAQIVDSRGRAGESTSIVLDPDGNPHIAYTRYELHRDGLNYNIFYSHWDGVRWLPEPVDKVDAIQTFDPYAVALALDSEGSPHIAYSTVDTLNYAKRVGDRWMREQLNTGGNYNSRVSMVLDSNDYPHIVYFNSEVNNLFYKHFDGAVWATEVIDPTVTDDLYHDIAVDGSNNPHVSYYSWDDDTLRYAHKVGGNWQSDTVEDESLTQDFAFTSIALDSSGNPGIAYNWNEEKDIKFAHWNGATWDIQTATTVPNSFDLQDRNALAFDSSDNPHIIYAPNNVTYIE
jgi:hypothetical protein